MLNTVHSSNPFDSAKNHFASKTIQFIVWKKIWKDKKKTERNNKKRNNFFLFTLNIHFIRPLQSKIVNV